MKRLITILLLLSGCAFSQTVTASNVVTPQLTLTPPATSPGAIASAVVTQSIPGTASYWYYIVASNSVGSVMSGPFAISNAPATLSSTAYITISFAPAANTPTYDVLRVAPGTTPSGACNCAVVTSTSKTLIVDNSNSLLAYTLPVLQSNATLQNNGNSVGSQNIEQVRYVDQFPGSDIGAQFNAAAASALPGSIIVLPCNGDRSVSTQLVINKPLQVVGCGRSGRLIPTVALTGKPMIYMALASDSAQFTPWADAVGMKLSDVWIEDTSGRGFQTDGILMNYVKHAHLHDITIEGLDGYALKLGDPSASTPADVSESNFDNLHFFWDGDSTDQLPVLDIYTPSGSGDDDNEIFFSDSQITSPYYWAIRIGTGNATAGPRFISFHGVQVEGREALYSTKNLNGYSFPVTVPVAYDQVEIQHGQNITFVASQFLNGGQGADDVNVIGSSAFPVNALTFIGNAVGGSTCVDSSGGTTVNTSGTAVTLATGYNFTSDGTWNGQTVTINGSSYTVANVASGTSMTLTTSAGTQSGVVFDLCGGAAYGINLGYVNTLHMAGNYWIGNTTQTVNYSTNAYTSAYDFSILDGQAADYDATDQFGDFMGGGTDAALGIVNTSAGSPGGQGWVLNSKGNGNFDINPKSNTAASMVLNNTLTVNTTISSFTSGLSWGGGTVIPSSSDVGSSTVFAQTSVQAGDTTSTDATAFASGGYTFPAGAFCSGGVGQVYHLHAQGLLTTSAADDFGFTAKIAGNAVAGGNGIFLPTGMSNVPVRLEVDVTCDAVGPSGSIEVGWIEYLQDGTSSNAGALVQMMNPNTAAFAVNTTGTVTIQVYSRLNNTGSETLRQTILKN